MIKKLLFGIFVSLFLISLSSAIGDTAISKQILFTDSGTSLQIPTNNKLVYFSITDESGNIISSSNYTIINNIIYANSSLKQYFTFLSEFANQTYAIDSNPYVYINYTLSEGTTNITWLHFWVNTDNTKRNNNVTFSTIENNQCWRNNLSLRFSLIQSGTSGNLFGDCWNGTGFENVLSIVTGDWSTSCTGTSSGGSVSSTYDGIYDYIDGARIYLTSLNPDEWGVCTNASTDLNRGYIEERIEGKGMEELLYNGTLVNLTYIYRYDGGEIFELQNSIGAGLGKFIMYLGIPLAVFLIGLFIAIFFYDLFSGLKDVLIKGGSP